MKELGTDDPRFLAGLMTQLGFASWRGKQLDGSELDFLLAVIKGVNPRDQVEAMLAAQMAAVHVQAMRFASKLANSEDQVQQDRFRFGAMSICGWIAKSH